MPSIKKIFICRKAGDAMKEVSTAEVEIGRGIVGDRYYFNEGTFSNFPKKNPKRRDITFISSEEIDKFNDILSMNIAYESFRRNVLTEGVDLNGLVGMEFSVGDCRFYGLELCEPCNHLANVVHPSILPAMSGRSGLRATVVKGGILTRENEFSV